VKFLNHQELFIAKQSISVFTNLCKHPSHNMLDMNWYIYIYIVFPLADQYSQ